MPRFTILIATCSLVFFVEAGGEPDGSHASAADAALELIGPDAVTVRVVADVFLLGNDLAQLSGGGFEEFVGLLVAAQQAFDFVAQFFIARAEDAEVGGAVLGRAFESAVKNLPDLRPTLRRQENLRKFHGAGRRAQNSNCA